jgi:RimJ/RimL family protein N-acetyltransferase
MRGEPEVTRIELQPTLRGELLEMRPLRSEDFDELFAVASDPLIWEQHPSRDRGEEGPFRIFFRESLESGGALVAIDRANGRIIGASRYHGFDPAKSEVEIGWSFLARRYWGGRFNREMKRLMLEHAFGFVDRVVFLVGRDNHRSRRAVEKIGAVEIGIRRNERGQEAILYGMTGQSFRAGPGATP